MDLKIRIPAQIWNDYQPAVPIHTSIQLAPTPKLTLRLRLPRAPSPSSIHTGNGDRRKRNDPHKAPAPCKVKLFRFHYGGPNRLRRGRWQNEITYERPCLKSTCKSCRQWHGKIACEDVSRDDVDGNLVGDACSQAQVKTPVVGFLDTDTLDSTHEITPKSR
jgi:hypothetical protein